MIIEGILEVLVMVGSAVKVLLNILPFIFLLIIIYLIFSYREDLHYRRINGSRILELDSLNKKRLCLFMAYLMRWLGYEEVPRPVTEEDAEEEPLYWKKDQETVDIVVDKEENRYAVLVEKRENGVGQQVFRKLEYAMEKYGCNKGIIINTGFFNSIDEEAASYGDIELWDREKLIRELLNLQGIEDTQGRDFNYHFKNFFRWVWHGG